MRLISTREIPPTKVPKETFSKRKYAILSHTWDDDEVTLSDLREPEQDYDSPSWKKIIGAQKQAAHDGLDWIWIDTLCIDKSSSAELSEAINSMYKWYKDASVCYVHFFDMPSCPAFVDWDNEDSMGAENFMESLRNCRWFKRGWTLQELIAPKAVKFYNRDWSFVATLNELASTVSDITTIHLPVLQKKKRHSISQYSVAQRMSWAAFRQTTRPEDRAYSLLGILDLNLDIRYGEGPRAFRRLQEEVIARSDDESVLAWGGRGEACTTLHSTSREDEIARSSSRLATPAAIRISCLLAPSPDEFAHARDLISLPRSTQLYRMTNMGLQTTAMIADEQSDDPKMVLNCAYQDDPTVTIGLHITKMGPSIANTPSYTILQSRTSRDVSFDSRLAHMDPLRVDETSVLHEMFLARTSLHASSVRPHPALFRPRITVWLRFDRDQSGREEFVLEQSKPLAECQHGNPIWAIYFEEQNPHLVPETMIKMTVRHDSGAKIFLRLKIKNDRYYRRPLAVVKLDASEDHIKDTIKIDSVSEDQFDISSSAVAQISINTELHIAATAHRKIVNHAEVHVVSMWSRKGKQLLLDSIRKFCDGNAVNLS